MFCSKIYRMEKNEKNVLFSSSVLRGEIPLWRHQKVFSWKTNEWRVETGTIWLFRSLPLQWAWMGILLAPAFIWLECHDLKLTTFSLSSREHEYLLEHGNIFQVAPGTAYRVSRGWVEFCTPCWLGAPLLWAQQLSVLTGSSHNQGLTFVGEGHLS